MNFTPHPYQTHAINHITTHPTTAILLGMGMGKTIITLTALHQLTYQQFTTRKTLIIAPLRVARDTWPAELKKWPHLKPLTMAICVGTPKQRQQALSENADITVINRENIPWLTENLTGTWPFDTVVIDELSSFKNPRSKRFKALKKIRPNINKIIGLTGTPAPNSLEDLWAQFYILDQGERLGQYITHYRSKYFTPDKRNSQRVFTWKLKPDAEQEIYAQIADITISMKTTDHLTLPPLTITTETVAMSKKELKQYRQMQQDMITTIEDETIIAGSAGVLSGKLQQLASGAIYTETGDEVVTIHDRKLDALEDLIESANGETVMVAYWFKHELQRLTERFPQGVPLATSEDIRRWNNKELPLVFIHPASAGHGLNLQAGGHIFIWFTVPWSLELYEQANARLFRQGQAEPVSIVRLATRGTIDEQVLQALERKDTTQSALIEAVKTSLTQGGEAA